MHKAINAMTILAMTASLAQGSAPIPDSSFRLVDGDVEAVIVGDDSLHSCVENGYRGVPGFLRLYIEKSTGRKLRQVAEAEYDAATMPFAVFLGGTKAARERHGALLAEADRDAYVVEVTPAAVYLVGARQHSTGYAMADFLYHALGVATYIPARWGTIVPRHEKVVLDPGLRLEVPAFSSRALSCLRTYHDTERLNYGGNADIPWRLYRRDRFSHALHTFITVAEFGKTNPEYFPEVNGKRVIVSTGAGPGPCIANPNVVRIITEKVLAFFADPKNADVDTVSLGMTDGGWCECEQCRAMDGPDINGNAGTSRRYYTFLNQVGRALKEKYPTKFIGVLGYAGADWPPADMDISRNIVPYLCQTRANWGDPDVKRQHLRQTLAWAGRVDRIGVYEYLYGGGFMVPRLYHQQLADYLRTVQASGSGGGFYAEIYSNHALDGPKAWVTEKLLWDPALDPARLQSEWCRAVFEGAAEPMDRYFQYLEACNTRNVLRCPQGRKGRDSKFYMLQDEIQFDLFLPEEIARAQGFLEEAGRLAARDEIRDRIRYFADGLRVTELSVKGYHAFRKAKELSEAGAGDAQVLAALIQGQATAPQEDAVLLMQELAAQDASAFTPVMPVSISTGTELSMRIVNGEPWSAVHRLIGQGERRRAPLVEAAKAQLLGLAPQGWDGDTYARQRVSMLLSMCERIAVAPRLESPPVIDGQVDDPAWQWQTDTPWWQWKSGIDYPDRADIAFAWHDRMLYVAYRCRQPNLSKEKTIEGYGAPAWKFVGMELHLNTDARDAGTDQPPHYLGIVALGGGLFSNTHEVVQAWKVTHTDDQWQAELALDLSKLGMAPGQVPAMRMNLVRNTRAEGHYGKGWFPSSAAHKDYHARGWLVFQP